MLSSHCTPEAACTHWCDCSCRLKVLNARLTGSGFRRSYALLSCSPSKHLRCSACMILPSYSVPVAKPLCIYTGSYPLHIDCMRPLLYRQIASEQMSYSFAGLSISLCYALQQLICDAHGSPTCCPCVHVGFAFCSWQH